nr:radial spoke head 14 homolog [Onthophagus taurus]
MFSEHKNSYLQLHCSGMNPRIINRSVDLARCQLTVDSGDFEPPWHRLVSEQPCIPVQNVDVLRRPLGFGRWAMPKLRRELHHPDEIIVIAALTTFIDLLKNPERGAEAITLRVPDRITDLLNHENPVIRERACMVLAVLAELADGKEAIVRHPKLLYYLALTLDDVENAVRIKAATVVEVVSDFWKAAEELVSFGYVPIILDCVSKDCEEIVVILLRALNNLMNTCDGMEEMFDYEAFDILMCISQSPSVPLKVAALKCLATLFNTAEGRDLAYRCDVLIYLNKLLHSEILELYQAALEAIMFATVKSAARIKALKVVHLSDRLVCLLHDYYNPPTQMHCLQCLVHLCEHPMLRKHVNENYYDEIATLYVGSDKELQILKDRLLSVINWQPEQG